MYALNSRTMGYFIKNCRNYVFYRSPYFSKINLNKVCCCYNKITFNRRFASAVNRDDYNKSGLDIVDNDDSFSDDEVYDKNYEELVKRAFKTPDMGHQVFIIQPYIKWGPSKNHVTKPDYQLDESVALIDTLGGWKVVDKLKISLTSFKKVKLFGSGNLELLEKRIRSNKIISAVFISINRLTYVQQEFLEDVFGVPVYDRYNIVIQIFHRHAVTKEAKLQVAMAEIPFMWYRIKSVDDKGGGGTSHIGGSGETFLELKKRILTDKEQKLKKALNKLETHRKLLRNKRKKKEFPVIAVVGYTNAGKTSLIKALTAEKNLQPKNQLFATLDVTVHEGILPSNVKVLYVDTIGFISDIPTELIEPFTVTLEDAIQSDLLIHVIDLSNPDIVAQTKHVLNTLHRLKLDNKLLTHIINVGNKCDLVSEDSPDVFKDRDDMIIGDITRVSCLNNVGLTELQNKIENVLLTLTGRIRIKIRIKCGGPEFSWLYKESSVVRVVTEDNDAQFVCMDVIITESNLMKFKHIFINSRQYHNR